MRFARCWPRRQCAARLAENPIPACASNREDRSAMTTIKVERAAQPPQRAAYASIEPAIGPTAQLLVSGGDARVLLDPQHGMNKYGCRPVPDATLLAFGSSTASIISEAGYAAADQLRRRLLVEVGREPHAASHARELNRVRAELLRLCDVSDLPGLEVAFAASGTDLHLISAQLASHGASMPTLVVMIDAAETGSGVPAALAGRHFSSRTALGESVIEGSAIAGDGMTEVVSVPIRRPDGTPRPAADVDADFEALVTKAAAIGQRVLLILVDLSKTGMIAPSPAFVAALHRRMPDTLDVLVDACQFRIASPTLRAYLEQGWMVALTGSKFLTGPTFSGALLIPAPIALGQRGKPFPNALKAYCCRADWSPHWTAAGSLDHVANFGLLLRWEAALEELRAFRAIPDAQIASFLQAFAHAVQDRLRSDPLFEPLPVSQPDRRPLAEATGWDHVQTIFPFLLYHPATEAGKLPLTRAESMQVYRLLQADLRGQHGFAITESAGDVLALRCQLGQPAACGTRAGVPVSALRLCASTRLITEATAQNGRHAAAVINRALAALDKAAMLVRIEK